MPIPLLMFSLFTFRLFYYHYRYTPHYTSWSINTSNHAKTITVITQNKIKTQHKDHKMLRMT